MEQPFSYLREKSGLSIHEIAERCGKSKRTIYRWENGETRPEKLALDILRSIVTPTYYADKPLKFTFIDLFAGIGGLRIAFEKVGGKCVYTCEYNKYSRQTYSANFNCEHPFVGDIREVDLDCVPSYDVLLAGFPCQPFSIAGVSKKNALGQPHGFACKTQGTLFFNVAAFIARHRPTCFLLENVKGLLSHDKGNTFRVIMETLRDELGYNVDYKVINAKGYLPQNRERVFIAGFRNNPFSFESVYVRDPAEGPTLSTILHPENGTEPEEPPYTYGDLARVADKYTLTPHLWSYLQEYSERHRKKGNGFGCGLVSPDDKARTLSARYFKDGSEILIKQVNKPPRRLTPRECARLMGFDSPDGQKFKIPVSDTQAYKQFGNAVAVPVVEEVAEYLLPMLLEAKGYIIPVERQLRLLMERKVVHA
jgi:DNA (cytosine-5)-methyltransferase 1